jgi:hypothetical protein
VNNQILATRLLIASTGAMLTVGHEAPCRMSALACRIESSDHSGKEGNSRQVSGTSDASKTQSGLTRSWLSFGQIFVENPVTTCRELSCTIAASTLMGRLTEKLILLAQIVLVGVGILSLVFGVFALIGTWLSHGS